MAKERSHHFAGNKPGVIFGPFAYAHVEKKTKGCDHRAVHNEYLTWYDCARSIEAIQSIDIEADMVLPILVRINATEGHFHDFIHSKFIQFLRKKEIKTR